MLPSYVCCADYAVAFYIAAEAAENAQFLYQTCAPYRRYGQVLKRSELKANVGVLRSSTLPV